MYFKKMAQKTVSLAILISLLPACAGRSANPVSVNRVDDYRMSCASVQSEMAEIDQNIRKLLPKTEKTGKNVALGVAGAFLFVPWFFMDFSEAEKVEIQAYQSRYNHLARLYNDKHCGKRQKPMHLMEQIEAAEKKRSEAEAAE